MKKSAWYYDLLLISFPIFMIAIRAAGGKDVKELVWSLILIGVQALLSTIASQAGGSIARSRKMFFLFGLLATVPVLASDNVIPVLLLVLGESLWLSQFRTETGVMDVSDNPSDALRR